MSNDNANPTAVTLAALKDVETATLTDVERNELVMQLRATLCKVQSPWQQMQSLVWENSGYAAALKTAHDLGVFKSWPEGCATATVEQLLKIVSPACDAELLTKVLNALSYKGTLNSASSGSYSRSEFARALHDPGFAICLDYWFDFQIPALSNLPLFLQKTSYALPLNPADTAWNVASGDATPFFGWLQQRPSKMGTFAQVMQCYSRSQLPWTELYPTKNLLSMSAAEASPAPVLVDVGGSLGHDVMHFVAKHAPPPRSCYLQDRPEVVEQALLVDGDVVVAQAHDFFQPQPVKGARAYYLHNILHDWPDEQCQTILSALKAAMTPGFSRILIHEIIARTDGAHDLLSVGEFTVMSILGAPERSEAQYRALVEAVGLKVAGVYTHPLSLHSILEVEL